MSSSEHQSWVYQFYTMVESYLSKNIRIWIQIVLIALSVSGHIIAQLDDIHYIPPGHNRNWNNTTNGDRYQAVYLSTPSITPITINITTGTGSFIKSFTISNSDDAVFDLNDYYGNNNGSYQNGDDNNLSNNVTFLSVPSDSLNTPMDNSGLILQGTDKFYANFRIKTGSQACSLTAKGSTALGREFYIGANPNNTQQSRDRTNVFVSFMASEDNTNVVVSGMNPLTEIHDNGGNLIGASHSFSLDRGQTYVISTYTDENMGNNTQNELIGARVLADKPIVMNNGNLLHAAVTVTGAARDMGMDQSVSIDWLGTQYAFIRGNQNNNNLETPIIIGISDNTDISVNGAYLTTISEGEYYQVNGSNYSSDGTMYIELNKRAYAYQQLFGSTTTYSSGLNFIPPLSCFLPTVTEFIPEVDQLHPVVDHDLSANITIITYAGSDVRIFDAGSNTPTQTLTATSDAFTIPGTSEWIAYIVSNQEDNVRIESDGPLATGVFGFSGANGIAGYYTGFGGQASLRQISLDTEISGTCTPIYSLEDVPAEADRVTWIRQSDNRIISHDTMVDIIHSGDYIAVVTNGTCADSLRFTVSCVQVSCEDYDEDGVNDISDMDADDDGILDSVECPLMFPVLNNNFTLNSDWTYSASQWSLGGGMANTQQQNVTNNSLSQSISGLNDACSDYIILHVSIASSGASNNISSTDTARIDFSLGGNDIAGIINPNGGTNAFVAITGANVKVDSKLFPISDQGNLQFFDFQFFMDWSSLPNVADLSINHSGQGDAFYINNIQLEFYDCGTSSDHDQDGIPNCLDLDSDNDGLSDQLESCQFMFTGPKIYLDNASGCSSGLIDGIYCVPLDFDNDGVDNYLDLDSDNDGVLDAFEAGHDLNVGSNGMIQNVNANIGTNGWDNRVESYPDSDTANYVISDSEQVPDFDYDVYELDSDDDGCFDTIEAEVEDLDEDGIANQGVAIVDNFGIVIAHTYSRPVYNWWQNYLSNYCQKCRTAMTNPHLMYMRNNK